MELIEKVYQLTENFPSKEQYGLTSQVRRAATSIAMNIAEGSGSGYDDEFRRFLAIALRSNYELMCGLEIAGRLGYCAEAQREQILSRADELSAMITGLRKKLMSDS